MTDLSSALASVTDLSAGSYVVSAKLWLSNSDEANAVGVACTLVSGEATLDESDVTVAASANATIPLSATTTFAEDGGAVSVSCSDGGAGTASAHHVKVTALRIGTLH